MNNEFQPHRPKKREGILLINQNHGRFSVNEQNTLIDLLRPALSDAVEMAQRNSGRAGRDIVRNALEACRMELVAAVGAPSAATLLRNLAATIERDGA